MSRRRRGDGLVRALIGVGVLAVLAGVLVGWWRPEPVWPRRAPVTDRTTSEVSVRGDEGAGS